MIDKEIADQIEEALTSDALSTADKRELKILLSKYKEHKKYNLLEDFTPFNYQKKVFELGNSHRYRFLCAANRMGKTHGICYEMALHLTGKYPKDWLGHRFDHPVKAWSIGMDAKLVADSLQEKLLGTNNIKLGNESNIGTGFIPRKDLKFETIQRDGMKCVSFQVKHYDENGVYDGDSELTFKSYAQGAANLQAATLDLVHMDEEPEFNSMALYTELLTRVRTTRGLVLISATPTNGLTELIKKFRDTPGDQECFINAGIPDVIPELFTEKDFEEMKQEYPKYQHGMRLYGDPSSAEGVIFDVDLDAITIEPITIPNHWRRCVGMDLGWNHPTTAIWSAYDLDNDTIYITDEYGAAKTETAIHASAVKRRGDYIPVILPHDAMQAQKNTGEAMIDSYRKEGLNVAHDTFYNFINSKGAKNIEPFVGISELNNRMKSGRLKIFSSCQNLIRELRNYRIKDNKIYKFDDDYVDAFRYSAMSVALRGVAKGSINDNYNLDSGYRGWN